MIPGCGHEEAMVDCAPCATWLAEQPAECEGRAWCSEDNGWLARDLRPVTEYPSHGGTVTLQLCPDCRRGHGDAVAREAHGDYLRDCAKDEAAPVSAMSERHKVLTDGKGKCSVPMWRGGMPTGFCDADAFGEQRAPRPWERGDNRLAFAPGLCCPGHGGPAKPAVSK